MPHQSGMVARQGERTAIWLSLSGEEAEDKLRQGGFLSFADEGLTIGHTKQTLISGIPVIIHRKSATIWSIGIGRSYVSYFINWLKSVCE